MVGKIDTDSTASSMLGGNFIGGMPGVSNFFETPEDRAGAARLQQMQQMAIEFDQARYGQSLGRQEAIMNMAGALSPLNEFVRGGTGFGIDLQAATAPVVGKGSPQWNEAIARTEEAEHPDAQLAQDVADIRGAFPDYAEGQWGEAEAHLASGAQEREAARQQQVNWEAQQRQREWDERVGGGGR